VALKGKAGVEVGGGSNAAALHLSFRKVNYLPFRAMIPEKSGNSKCYDNGGRFLPAVGMTSQFY